ncbi:MAG TPA: lipid-binding SYLF domain-containing protein [Terriglobales bacterium]|nr:lipid-binding SYLF domain-containing protein [Terriglobales bacterium]
MRRATTWWAGALALGLMAATPTWLSGQSTRNDDVARLKSATEVFQQVMATPDKAIPEEILDGAQCIAIIPGMKKGAFVFGANYGKGVATCREGTHGSWGPPLFVTIGGGSWGLQIGAQSSDIVMVFGNRNQLNSLLSSKFRVGAEAAAAAGPVGRHVEAGTDIKLNSEILTYGRSKGAFAGISISGAVVQPDTTGNQAMYGEHANVQDILSGKGVTMPAAAQPLVKQLDTHAATSPGGKGI